MANGLFGGGDGNAATPFIVEDGADLNAVRNALGKAYKQVANIDLSAYANWVPIGTNAVPFTGTYDGGDFTIANLNSSGGGYRGLFGKSNTTLNGIHVISGTVSSNAQYVGAIAGYVTLLTNCSNRGCSIISTWSSTVSAGGLCGNGSVRDCYNYASVTASVGGYAGGVSGGLGTATRCYNTGDITAFGDAFGVSEGHAYNSYNTGVIKSIGSAGSALGIGLANATDCYNTGEVSTSGAYAAGVALGDAIRCYNTGTVTTTSSSFVRHAYGISRNIATDCYNTNTVESRNGIAYGICPNTATRCYNSGNLRASSGGYGITIGIAINCYSLCDTITRITGSTNTTAWAKVTPNTTTSTVGNYALDTMQLVWE